MAERPVSDDPDRSRERTGPTERAERPVIAVAGVTVGHWTDHEARTGCTVVRFPEATVASAEVRGGAPATRELELLAPHRRVTRLDAVVLAGGSAFGLATADGVMEELAAEGVGFATPSGPVPIVVGLCLFDLAEGDPLVRPGPDEGAAACRAARSASVPLGRVGAGAGAQVGMWRGPEAARPGGLVAATVRDDDGPDATGVVVSALLAVNAVGDPGAGPAPVADAPLDLGPLRQRESDFGPPGAAGQHTTIGVVVTDARLDKTDCLVVAQGGHDGMARAIFPPHTGADGDALVAAATGRVDAPLDLVRAMAVVAVERAIATLA